jgi:hypothetical protein
MPTNGGGMDWFRSRQRQEPRPHQLAERGHWWTKMTRFASPWWAAEKRLARRLLGRLAQGVSTVPQLEPQKTGGRSLAQKDKLASWWPPHNTRPGTGGGGESSELPSQQEAIGERRG